MRMEATVLGCGVIATRADHTYIPIDWFNVILFEQNGSSLAILL